MNPILFYPFYLRFCHAGFRVGGINLTLMAGKRIHS